jgi:hypothetical protein
MARRWRIVLGVALVLAGLCATIAGLAIALLVGTDGSIGLPPTRIVAAGTAITLPQLDVPELPRRASVVLDVALEESERPMFVGVGPSAMVDAYLRDAPIDVIEQIDWPGAARTTPIEGSATPGPPGRQTFWATSTSGRTPHLRWEATPGDWTLVIMAVAPRSPLDVTVTGSVTISILGPIGIGVLVVAIALLASGIWLTVRAAGRGASPRSATPAPPAS